MVQDVSRILGPLVLAGSLAGLGACAGPEEAALEGDSAPAETSDAAPDRTASDDPSFQPAPDGPPLDGFKQYMKRGNIPALFEPQFVPASEAEIPANAWVMAFELGGQAYAYDLNILNHHEVVNHAIGDLPVAAVW